MIPSGIIAEPGKDVFAKDDRDKAKSSARGNSDSGAKDVVSSSGDGEPVVSMEEGVRAEEKTQVGGAREPVEAGEVPAGEDQIAVPVGKQPEGPLDREEALADQIAHELYPEARNAAEQGFARDQ